MKLMICDDLMSAPKTRWGSDPTASSTDSAASMSELTEQTAIKNILKKARSRHLPSAVRMRLGMRETTGWYNF